MSGLTPVRPLWTDEGRDVTETETRPCPSCREDVKADATRCRHCYGDITDGPGHGGTCPLCREDIHPEATRCQHCKSSLVAGGDCGCGTAPTRALTRSGPPRIGNRVIRAVPHNGTQGVLFDERFPSRACTATAEFRDGTYDYIGEDDDYCYYWGPRD